MVLLPVCSQPGPAGVGGQGLVTAPGEGVRNCGGGRPGDPVVRDGRGGQGRTRAGKGVAAAGGSK